MKEITVNIDGTSYKLSAALKAGKIYDEDNPGKKYLFTVSKLNGLPFEETIAVLHAHLKAANADFALTKEQLAEKGDMDLLIKLNSLLNDNTTKVAETKDASAPLEAKPQV